MGKRLLDAEVAVDQMARPAVDDDLGDVSDGVQHLAEGLSLGLSMRAPVGWPGQQLVGASSRSPDPVGPGRGGGYGRARHVQVVA